MSDEAGDIALAGSLAFSELAAVIDELTPHLEYLWIESPGTAQLIKMSSDVVLEQCDAGRAFGANVEVRWQRHDQRVATMVTTSGPTPTQVFPHTLNVAQGCSIERVSYLLLGEQGEGDTVWHAPGIPSPLHYPVQSPARRVRLDAIVYRGVSTGDIVATRYTGLRGDQS